LLEPLTREQARSVKRKRDRHTLQVNMALKEWNEWLAQNLPRIGQAVAAIR
jgi:hypothetical protein